MTEWITCARCIGQGKIMDFFFRTLVECPTCQGAREIRKPVPEPDPDECPSCHAKDWNGSACASCQHLVF